MSKRILFNFILIFFWGCSKEESSYTESILSNKTSHSINIIPYYHGTIVHEEVQNIPKGIDIVVLNKSNRGKGTGYSYFDHLAIFDSTQIAFDDTVKLIHYSYYSTNSGFGSTGIPYTHNRSIYNGDNYIRRIVSEGKYKISNEYTFIFTEKDYFDAKEK
jgi:hypothetical protein